MAQGDYTIENIYQGGYSSLEYPKNRNYISAGSLGLTTDPRTANVLKEVSTKLSSGAKHIELALVTPQIFDAVPNQQLKEVRRLGELTGVEVSVHAPVIDTTGITQQGFSELNREVAERSVSMALERSQQLSAKGSVPVVFHSAEGFPGSDWKTLGKTNERQAKRLIVVDRKTGQLMPLEKETRYYPGISDLEKGEKITPEERIGIANKSKWDNSISQLIFNKERADEILDKNKVPISHLLEDHNAGRITQETLSKFPEQRKAINHVRNAEAYLQDLHKNVYNLFSDAYEQGTDQQKHELKKLSEKFKEELGDKPDIFRESQAMQTLIQNLRHPGLAPNTYVPIEEFAIKQSSKTFGNAAFNSYKKFKDKAPLMCIENPPAGFALSTGEDLKNLIKASREEFVKKAVDEGILSERQAQREAEKLIGAAWDVGHINMLRKSGFTEKDIIKESETIAPMVKHVHLSDNFGFEHTELPMGMGNVPVKEILEKLGEKGFEAKKIIEAGAWWQHFQTPPLQETMEYFGSPVYSSGVTPYWNQAPNFIQGYVGGYGNMLPQINYEIFGAGFSQLPSELGGQRGGAGGSRMSGKPME